ncbi:MAG: ABC transporter ATP-binding protein [bacterium]
MNLTANDISFAYHQDRPILNEVSLTVQAGIVTALFGPNGCGKSTLLKCLNGSLRPSSGCVTLDDEPVNGMSSAEVARHVAVVPQDMPRNIPFTVHQMVMLGRYAHGQMGRESAEDCRIVESALSRVDANTLGNRFFSQLSGGERQRIAIAIALAQQGKVLLLDEPASHLDISHQLEFYRLVRQVASEGQAVLMVCHDILLAPLFTDRCVLMKAGSILEAGKAEDVLRPANLAHAYGCHAEILWGRHFEVQARFPEVPQ